MGMRDVEMQDVETPRISLSFRLLACRLKLSLFVRMFRGDQVPCRYILYFSGHHVVDLLYFGCGLYQCPSRSSSRQEACYTIYILIFSMPLGYQLDPAPSQLLQKTEFPHRA